MDKKIAFNHQHYSRSWPWKMAWRDSRKSRGKLVLFIASISLGIAALVGITSFRENLLGEINDQSKSLLGADVSIRGNQPLPDSLHRAFVFLTGDDSKETYFASMVYFPNTMGTRLAQVRALEGKYPYYGAIETSPPEAAVDFKNEKSALVDEKLMIQFNVEIGDSVRVGRVSFEIVGKLRKIPGQTNVGSAVAPVVYIPYQYLEKTGLIQKGSRINYIRYFQFHPDLDTTNLWHKVAEQAENKGYDVDTIEDRKKETGRAFRDLSSFLELIAFTALLLGCLGVASSIYVYSRSKTSTVAVLRCLGMKSRQAISVFLIQVVIFGIIGAMVGAFLGSVLHLFLPEIAKDFIPVTLTPEIYWPAILVGLGIGIAISLLFGLLSMVGLRNVSPLTAIRSVYSPSKTKWDTMVVLIGGVIFMLIFLGLLWLIGQLQQAVIYTLILSGSMGLLFGIAKLLSWSIKKVLPRNLPFVWRQGLSNLYRPNNQTVVLIMTIGLATSFLATLYFMQDLLIQRISLIDENERPNTILFDIQTQQKEELKELTLNYDLPVMQDVPIVTMRLLEINGQTREEAEEDSTVSFPNWAFNREYRVTYRDSLIESETLADGKWLGKVNTMNDSIYVSISKGFAENLGIKIGDELLFNVQGAHIITRIGSFRTVDWNRVQTNFLVVFPTGVLEQAPQFHVLVTRIDKTDVSARYQQAVVRLFPNVSIIDLELILKTIEEILSKVAFVIQFMALFSIGTGIVVLISAIVLSKFQRMKENVLLRTLGASRQQLWKIISAEYFFLGALGSVSGILLAALFSSLLGIFAFEFTFIPNFGHMSIIIGIVTLMCVIIGLINSRSIINQSPLEVLRKAG